MSTEIKTEQTEIKTETSDKPRTPVVLKIEELSDVFGGSRCPPRKETLAFDGDGGGGGGGDSFGGGGGDSFGGGDVF
jgi:hypothetical protein